MRLAMAVAAAPAASATPATAEDEGMHTHMPSYAWITTTSK